MCILHDQSIQADLEKERIAKKYMKSFFAMITHELRNPLHGILGIFEGLLDQLPVAEKSMISQCEMGVGTIKLMMRLVNDLLDISQIETEKFRLVNEDFKVKDAAQDCIELMRYRYKIKGISLIYKEIGWIPTIVCDKNRYKQILLNLLGNSLKFTEKGNVTIECSYNFNEKMLLTSVQDTGVGMVKSDSSKLFTFFGKLEDTAAINPQGSGLGLYISRKLTEAMGGIITLDSVKDEGTKVTFSISNGCSSTSRDLDESIPSERIDMKIIKRGPNSLITQSSFAMKTHDNTILIVDDEVICVNTLQYYLKNCGLTTDIVNFLVN